MVAIEGGLRSKSDELFNNFPDRLSDTFLLTGAGFAAGGRNRHYSRFVASITVMLTAYARVLGGAAGARQHFLGPMAKQHRMALLSAAAVVAAMFDGVPAGRFRVLAVVLSIIIAGSLVTTVRRLHRVRRELEEQP